MHATPVGESGSPRVGGTRFVLAAIAALVGLVWALQGLGLLPDSFMTGDPVWLAVGVALIGLAAAYAAWPALRRR